MEHKIDIDAIIKERLNVILDNTCKYKLPCGWCEKWEDVCVKEMKHSEGGPQRGLRAGICIYDEESVSPCRSCATEGQDELLCQKCLEGNFNLFVRNL